MTEHAVLYMFILLLVYLVYQTFVKLLRCRYCGKVAGHEEHCPFAGSGL